MDIALLLPTLGGGGAERVALTLLRAFERGGRRCDVVVMRREGRLLLEVPAETHMVALRGGTLRSLPAFVRYLRQRRPRAILAFMPPANVLAVLGRWLSRGTTTVVLSEHSHPGSALQQTRWYKRPLIRSAYLLFYRAAERIVAVSEGMKRDLARICGLPEARVGVIWNPILDDAFRARARGTVEHPWFERSEGKTLLAVGRLGPEKDYPTLLRTVARLPVDLNVRLIVVGEGSERQRLEGLAREVGLPDRVQFLGFLENPLPYMARADLLVLSSRFEGLGNVLVEAMALGTPVVSTDCPSGPREVLADGKYGRLVSVGDVAALAEAIEATLRNPPDPVELVVAAERFDAETIAQRYLTEIDRASSPPAESKMTNNMLREPT